MLDTMNEKKLYCYKAVNLRQYGKKMLFRIKLYFVESLFNILYGSRYQTICLVIMGANRFVEYVPSF